VTVTAGQDRRVGVYTNTQEPYHIKSDFLVFCVGISPSGKIGVYSSGEENSLQLFNTETKIKDKLLVGHKGIINQIKFINENELFTSSRDNYVLQWKLNQ
jgi:WD40 repeat protein